MVTIFEAKPVFNLMLKYNLFLLTTCDYLPLAVHKIFETRPSVSDRAVSCPQRSCHPPTESFCPCLRCRRLSCRPSPWRWVATPPEIQK